MLAVVRNDLRIMRHDYFPIVVLVAMPLVGMVFMKSAFKGTVIGESGSGASGAQQAVPGMAVTFGFALVGYTATGFFREHSWATWDRLRASPASTLEIVLGKMGACLLLAALQLVLLFCVGGLAFGLHVRGSWLEVCAVGVSFSVCLVATGLAIAAACASVMQANAFTYIGMVLFSCMAGALVPAASLPQWAKVVAPAIPSYWAMRGYRSALMDRSGTASSVAVLLAFAVVLLTFAALRLRVDEMKRGYV
jgi:ABC-2 type transport system permease protein